MSDSPTPPKSDDAPANRVGDALGLAVRGLAMGAADVVPGVSGGTIAFITGIYERFVGALKSLSPEPMVALVRRGPRAGFAALRAIHWGTLLPLGLGIVVAIVAFSKVITGLMATRQGPTYALFFGLIAASAWTPIARIRSIGPRHWGALAIAALGAFVLVGFTPSGTRAEVSIAPEAATHALYLNKVRATSDTETLRAVAPEGLTLTLFDPKGFIEASPEGVELLTDETALERFVEAHPALAIIEASRPGLPYIFLCGLVAISAMILPGLSGSFLLLMLGVYAVVFGAVHRVVDYLKLWSEPDLLTSLSARPAWSDAALVGVFLVGVVIGLGTFSRVVSWLFARAHDVTMAALTGLMIGALRLPFEKITSDPAHEDGAGYWAIVAVVACVGAALVIGLHLVERRLQRRHATA